MFYVLLIVGADLPLTVGLNCVDVANFGDLLMDPFRTCLTDHFRLFNIFQLKILSC